MEFKKLKGILYLVRDRKYRVYYFPGLGWPNKRKGRSETGELVLRFLGCKWKRS